MVNAVCSFCCDSCDFSRVDALLRRRSRFSSVWSFGAYLRAQRFDRRVAALARGEGEACAEVAFAFIRRGGGLQRVADQHFGAGALVQMSGERLLPKPRTSARALPRRAAVRMPRCAGRLA